MVSRAGENDRQTSPYFSSNAQFMLVFNRTLFALLAISVCALVNAQDQLPSESVLPGEVVPTEALPSEAMLPGEAGVVEDQTLPGEDLLAGDDGAIARDVDGAIAGSKPALRLAFDGHTGLIKTLDLSEDGRTMVTGGEDKELHVWRRTELSPSGWLHHKTIRWPIWRGPLGQINKVAVKNDLVAFGGYGKYGAKGELRVVNAASGDLVSALVGQDESKLHTAVILSLAWSPVKEPRLASLDKHGQVNLWRPDANTGKWEALKVVPTDTETYGEANGQFLKPQRQFGAVTFAGPNYLIVPRYVGYTEGNSPVAKWHLQRLHLNQGPPDMLTETDHIESVLGLTATSDGRVLASSDLHKTISIWKFESDGKVASSHQFKTSQQPLFMDLDEEGTRLLIGGVPDDPKERPELQVWDVQQDPPKLISKKQLDGIPFAGKIDRKHGQGIASIENDVLLFNISKDERFVDEETNRLSVPVKPIHRLAFAKDGSYKIAFGWSKDGFDGVFDLTENKLLGRGPIRPEEFLKANRTRTRWTLEGNRLVEDAQPRGQLPLKRSLHGIPTNVWALPALATGTEESGEIPEAGAVMVGSTGWNNVYAFRANDSDPPELIRQFRDHKGYITSLATSADGNYMVTGSGDTMVSVWNLQGLYTASKLVNRWGCEFEIEGDRLIVADIRENGPLYFQGVRNGDHLQLIKWRDRGESGVAIGEMVSANEPAKIRAQLQEFPFDALVVFEFSRMRRPLKSFQSLAAWRPLATLFVDQSRQWAMWTPSGYYNASFNGHQLFGWQIDRTIDQTVEYYRAAQFRKRLERPDAMRRLLAEGSLPAAMRATLSGIGPPPSDSAIVSQIESAPKIRLLSPDPAKRVDGDSLQVVAEIESPLGATLVTPKAFVSGVPAVNQRVIPNGEDAGQNTVTYQWDFRLPSDSQLQLEILAATEAEALDRMIVNLNHTPAPGPRRRKLHVLAIGASEYRDPQIQSLDFAADAAGRVSQLFRDQSSTLYDTSADELTNSDATRPLWRVFAQNAADRLSKTVSPDDLVIMYLCGHGLRDRRTNQWYFVTADARYSDLMNDRYEDCIAFSDLSALAKLPCRKLAILDSCHSGAVQPVMRQEDLKSALRFLQDDVVLTMTASEGDEEAAEKRETGLGRFTTKLVEALEGAADANGDGEVVLNEAIEYVTTKVTEESELEGMPQHPTASPAYLLQTLRLPLTSVLKSN
ncbi:MAG: hypothetical protein AB8B91_07705 [Rubripirellula sp.]